MSGTIAPFNKGAFHLATNLAAPIVPMYIKIPREIDPGWSYDYRAGVVDVYIQPAIETADWDLKDLEDHCVRTRELFLEMQDRYHAQQS